MDGWIEEAPALLRCLFPQYLWPDCILAVVAFPFLWAWNSDTCFGFGTLIQHPEFTSWGFEGVDRIKKIFLLVMDFESWIQEFRRTKNNISLMREHAELLTSVRNDISEYKVCLSFLVVCS
jgi:hypothetical protein